MSFFSNIWNRPDKEREKQVADAGGISVPFGAVVRVDGIISEAFDQMESHLALTNTVLPDLFLSYLNELEKRLKHRAGTKLRDISRRTKNYGLVTREMAYDVMCTEYGNAFGKTSNIAKGFIPADDSNAIAILGMLEEKVIFDTMLYIDTWVYLGTL